MKEWYCAVDGRSEGPFPEEVLADMIRSGAVTPDTLLWNADDADKGWVSASSTEIASFFTAAPDTAPHAFSGFSSGEAEAGFELATRSQRFLAYLLDFVLFTFILGISFLILAFVFSVYGESHPLEMMFLPAMIAFLPAIAYSIFNVYLIAVNCQTVGKKIMNIKIARTDGSSASVWRILMLRGFVTGLLCAIPLINIAFIIADICFILREDHRMLHDFIGGTIVIRK
jgi:uncharacterized RDD family membrane protein YckC